jgi:hypothetical protein
MNVAYISALSALAGSIIGGLTTGITTWLNQRSQARAVESAREMSRREDLYRDFIVAASKAYGDAIVSSDLQIQDLVGLYAMVSRMRVLSSSRTIACADDVVRTTIDTYFAPNKTVRELHDMIKSGVSIDPLKEFSEAAREELRTLALL